MGEELFSKFYITSPVFIDLTKDMIKKYADVLRDIFPTISSMIVRMDSLAPNSKGIISNFDDVEIIDFGNAIRFGEYEERTSLSA